MNPDKTEYERKRKRLIMARHRRTLKEKACAYKGGRCEICGYDKNLAARCFHHKDPQQKDFAIGHRTKCKWGTIQKELDKCELLCIRCHAEIHDTQYREELEKLETETGVLPRARGRRCLVCGTRFVTETNQRKCECCVSMKSRKTVNLSVDTIKDMIQHKSLSEIASIYNCGITSITRFCAKYKIERPQRCVLKINWPTNLELAALVFQKPLIHLSKDLGVSDTAIKKHCRNNGINLPPQGFWTKRFTK